MAVRQPITGPVTRPVGAGAVANSVVAAVTAAVAHRVTMVAGFAVTTNAPVGGIRAVWLSGAHVLDAQTVATIDVDTAVPSGIVAANGVAVPGIDADGAVAAKHGRAGQAVAANPVNDHAAAAEANEYVAVSASQVRAVAVVLGANITGNADEGTVVSGALALRVVVGGVTALGLQQLRVGQNQFIFVGLGTGGKAKCEDESGSGGEGMSDTGH